MRTLIFVIFLLFIRTSYADLALDKTRLIINEQSGSGDFKVRNTGSAPVLVQSWVSGLSDNTDAESSDAAAIPPVFRLLPGEIKSVRIVSFVKVQSYQEKLLSVNVQQIPTVDGTTGKNTISVSMRMRFKLMVRGNELISSDIQDRINKLDCAFLHSQDGERLSCLNTSGYHYIINSIKDMNKNLHCTVDADLIKPDSRTLIRVAGGSMISDAVLELIDDNGQIYNYVLRKNSLAE